MLRNRMNLLAGGRHLRFAHPATAKESVDVVESLNERSRIVSLGPQI